MPTLWQLLLVPLLIALNAFFVATEYALVATRSAQLETMRARGWHSAAAAVAALKRDMASAIGGVQVCITMTNLVLGWIGEPAMSAVLLRALAPLGAVLPPTAAKIVATAVGFVLVTLLTVVMSELLPKALTLQHTLTVARLTARPMVLTLRLIRPLVWVMNFTANAVTRVLGLGAVKIEESLPTPDELRAIASEAGEAGVLTPRERSLILNTLSLGRRRAADIMVPRVRVDYLDLRWPMDENHRVVQNNLYSRLPLCDGGMDRVVGVVYTKEFLTAYPEAPGGDSTVLTLLARRAVFAPVQILLDRLLATFAEKQTHFVFLVDEHGGVAGIVTVTDVIDELVGEISEAPAPPSPVS